MSPLGAYPCLCVDDVMRSVAFYRDLLDLEVTADAGWYVELGRPPRRTAHDRAAHDRAARHSVDATGEPPIEVFVAFVERGHPTVPAGSDRERGGVLVSVVVDDAAGLAERAASRDVPLAQPCRDEPFGQRHFMAIDPDGFLVDVIERIPPSLEFRRQLVAGRRRQRA
jgi:catechol 2,3-dioxygenase-like lactoylglutathione lyase family enzyme